MKYVSCDICGDKAPITGERSPFFHAHVEAGIDTDVCNECRTKIIAKFTEWMKKGEVI